MVRRKVAVALLAGSVGGCTTTSFTCSDDEQCTRNGQAGVCQSPGYCAFPDPDCGGEHRFGAHAGDDLAGACVGTSSLGTSSAGATSSSSADTSSSVAPSSTESDDASSTSTSGSSTSSTDPTSEAGSSTGEPLDPTLVLWYRFDDALDDGALDSTDANLHAACSECPTSTPGIDGNAAQFDGATQFLRVPQSPTLDLTEELTVAFWARRDAWADEHTHFTSRTIGSAHDNSWEVFTLQDVDSNDLHIRFGDEPGSHAGGSVPVPPETDVWHHYALLWDGSTGRLYLDAEPVVSVRVLVILYDDHPVLIAADNDDGMITNFIAATIDDYRIYSRALDPAEIEALATP